MLMQSHDGGINLLPCPPNRKPAHGSHQGAAGAGRVSGGYILEGGLIPLKVSVTSTTGGQCKVRHGEKVEFDTSELNVCARCVPAADRDAGGGRHRALLPETSMKLVTSLMRILAVLSEAIHRQSTLRP